MTKKLREGFTTGSAVAGATKAALLALLNGNLSEHIDIPLPPFEKELPRARLSIPLSAISSLQKRDQNESASYAIASVVKDGGDDPDATSGITIHVIASFLPLPEVLHEPSAITDVEWIPQPICKEHKDIIASLATEQVANGFLCLQLENLVVKITTGTGIGIVTLPGLPIAVGEPAINPEPRKQLCAAIREVLPSHIRTVYLHIEAPEGVKRAKKTLNPKLGIKGGISILGTHGIVRPYSHDAFTKSITQGLDVAIALGAKYVFLTTGRRSERLLLSRYPDHLPQAGIQIADYAAHAVREATAKGVKHIVWGCFPGKLVKLSQGLEWTHASQGAPDIGVLSDLWIQVGGTTSLTLEILAMPTAVGAFSLMKASNTDYYKEVIRLLGKKALSVLRSWCEYDDVNITLHVFSMESEHLLFLNDMGKF